MLLKRKVIAALALVFACSCLVVVTLAAKFGGNSKSGLEMNEPAISVISKTDDISEIKETNEPFFIKIYEGKIGVYYNGRKMGEPDKIYDVAAESLPPSDMVILSQGISMMNYDEVLMLIEDLSS